MGFLMNKSGTAYGIPPNHINLLILPSNLLFLSSNLSFLRHIRKLWPIFVACKEKQWHCAAVAFCGLPLSNKDVINTKHPSIKIFCGYLRQSLEISGLDLGPKYQQILMLKNMNLK
eukprot:GHVP01005920.1.p1 GENE.GHVP01005920.1~~GHVP01005920.1.p1  ORF type:complete len:116 (+),score=14.12 GHVP01005920.1:150-497(+)